ncbi:hypothetical protein EMIT043CA1_220035 [Pseudomonas brassicacearum]
MGLKRLWKDRSLASLDSSYAPQREQAPSPQKHSLEDLLLLLTPALRPYTARGLFTSQPRSG